MHRSTVVLITVVVTLAALAGCASNRVSPLQLSADEQFERGMALYEEGRFRRALEYLEPFMRTRVADPRMPDVLFTVGEIHMERREYVSAADLFQRVTAQYQAHPLATEARFRVCEAYVELSPRPELDQQYTHAAIAHCTMVADLFPQTEMAEAARAHVERLETTLAEKLFRNGEFYQRRRALDAALVYYQKAVDEYPRTAVAPRALRQIVEIYETLRYEEEAEEARQRLVRDYPESPEAAEVRA